MACLCRFYVLLCMCLRMGGESVPIDVSGFINQQLALQVVGQAASCCCEESVEVLQWRQRGRESLPRYVRAVL